MSIDRPAKLRQQLNHRGFTLVEVLVALAVVVVSFMAIYGVILQMVGATTLMQEKTLASWVAFDRITELRVQQEFPDTGKRKDVTEMGGISWQYEIEIRATDSDNIRQVIVKVAPESEPENITGLASGALVRNNALPPSTPGGLPDGFPGGPSGGPVN
jgi:general secretion pathway protein I